MKWKTMDDADFIAAEKALKLNEQNILREVELKIQDAHKTEEAALRKELEKKHAQE